jgi:SH3 domain protein
MRYPGLRRLCLLTLLLACCGVAPAAFISDRVEVDITASPGQGARLGTVGSGSSVEVLAREGDYARIRTDKNITGWIEARYLSETLTAANPGAGISAAELAELRQKATDAGWLRGELNKAREQLKKLEGEPKPAAAPGELEQLRAQKAELEQRLNAILLVNKNPVFEELAGAPEDAAGQAAAAAQPARDWRIGLEWFIGSLVSVLVIGFILGFTWLDRRIRRRHGGFRIY